MPAWPRRKTTVALIAAALLALPGAAAIAADMEVSTTRLLVSGQAPIAAMNVRNAGDEPLAVQAFIVRWMQRDGQDVYEPTRDILVNPPIFTLAPNAVQIARFGLKIAPGEKEQTYRLFLQEIPKEPQTKQNVTTILRISIPIFVAGTGERVALETGIYVDSTGSSWAEFVNRGTKHVQVTGVSLSNGSQKIDVPTSTYVLQGQFRRLPLTGAMLKVGDMVDVTLTSDHDQALPSAKVRVADGPSSRP